MENMVMVQSLIDAAVEAMGGAYAPYSHFQVGAALLTKEGRIYRGCNIENASYGATNCAERTAIFKAVSEGERDFSAIAIVGGLYGDWIDYAPPCGICRQVMSEFCDSDFRVILARKNGEIRELTMEDVLPVRFAL